MTPAPLLIFDVADLDELERILADDEYYRTDGVTVVRRTEWTPLFR